MRNGIPLPILWGCALLCALSFLAPGSSMASTDAPLADSAEEICPRLIGTRIPSLQLRLADGSGVSLDSLLALRPTVLVFFRGGW